MRITAVLSSVSPSSKLMNLTAVLGTPDCNLSQDCFCGKRIMTSPLQTTDAFLKMCVEMENTLQTHQGSLKSKVTEKGPFAD